MTWYIQDPKFRFRHERDSIDGLASTVEWLAPGEWRMDSALRLVWDGDILFGGDRFPVSLRYPSHFPDTPAIVLPRGVAERWSSHQYGAGGELCLEYGPDNWRPEITGADLLKSAFKLLSTERSPGLAGTQVPSRHATTLGQDLSGNFIRLVVTKKFIDVINTLPVGEVWAGKLICIRRGKHVIYFIQSFSSLAGMNWVESDLPPQFVEEEISRDVAIIRWPENADLPPTTNRVEFLAAVSGNGFRLPDVIHVVILCGVQVNAYSLWSDGNIATKMSVVPPSQSESRLSEEYAALKQRSVAIVGCGSLGGKVAAMLARAGIEKYLLVDDDILLSGNLVRHELDWREVGNHKVDGVARRIKYINSAARCDVRQYRLGGQQSSGSIETLVGTLATYDLIVDATADSRVFNYLCAAVKHGKKQLVWAEVFGGGIGGMVARYRPGLDPEPTTIRAKIEQWHIENGIPQRHETGGYETQIAGVPLIADDADVTVIAAHTARFAIDGIIPRDPSMFPYSVYMIGLSGGFLDQPFDARPVNVGPALPAGDEALNQDMQEKELAEILRLMKKFSDENPAPSSSCSTPG